MDHIIVGTAGHIDHGKTSLVKALTGVETDRLKEEKQRGITIELGFASLVLPDNTRLGIVDMPGHEKFVKNMVAGASGIDLVVMVIAADEGVMPQTREHMEICQLMGIEHGMIALTKIDLVDEELLELARADIEDFVQDTFLEDKPVAAVSASKGQGLDAFVATLQSICQSLPERKFSSVFRLPVDRVFSMKGFGTVITGTLISGRVQVGNEIMVYPGKISSRVRGIQVHSESVDHAVAGTRTAINFKGLDKDSVKRGDIVSTPNALAASHMVDAHFSYLPGNQKPLKPRTRVRFHSGTSEILGYMILLDKEELLPGQGAKVQFRLEHPVCCIKDDRYVIRSYSPIKTIGGGNILCPAAHKHKQSDPQVIQGLTSLMNQEDENSIVFVLSMEGFSGMSLEGLKIMTNIPDKPLAALLQKMLARQEIFLIDKERQVYLSGAVFRDFKEKVLERLENFHRENPLKEGMSAQELKSKFPYIKDPRIFTVFFTRLVKEGLMIQEKDILRLSNFTMSLAIDEKTIKDRIARIYRDAGLQPPFFRTICQELELDKKTAMAVLHILMDEKAVIKIRDDFYFDANAIADFQKKLVSHLQEHSRISPGELKEMAGVSRKFIIPIMEYFDSIHLTLRVGDDRQLRRSDPTQI